MRRQSGTSSQNHMSPVAPLRLTGSLANQIRVQSFKSAGTFPPFAASLFMT
jgi:hypothetical protein